MDPSLAKLVTIGMVFFPALLIVCIWYLLNRPAYVYYIFAMDGTESGVCLRYPKLIAAHSDRQAKKEFLKRFKSKSLSAVLLIQDASSHNLRLVDASIEPGSGTGVAQSYFAKVRNAEGQWVTLPSMYSYSVEHALKIFLATSWNSHFTSWVLLRVDQDSLSYEVATSASPFHLPSLMKAEIGTYKPTRQRQPATA